MKALILAGGVPQIALIKNLKKRGYHTILADYTTHPLAEEYADKFYCKSTLDVDAIKKIAVDEKVDLVFTVCTDQALNTVALVSEELGLPCYIDAETGRNVTNKKYMKQVFAKSGIPTAKCVIVEKGQYDIPDNLHFPLIVKPVDCNSSKGVVKVQSSGELKKALENACEYSRTGNAIVEEFIEGKEISVDVYVHNGQAEILCVSESEKIRDNEKFIIFRSVVPAGIEGETYLKIKDTANKIAKAFGLKSCPMLIQMLYKDGDIYVIEFSARTGGGLKFRLIEQNSGVDIIDMAIDASLGNDRQPIIHYSNKYIVNEFIYTKGGIFDRLEGFEELKKDGVIESYHSFKSKGAEFDGINSSGDRVAAFTIVADTYDELAERHKKALGRVKVIDILGNDMMRHDLTYEISKREISKIDLRG